MGARIVAVGVIENRYVKRGQLLIQLDDSDLRAQLNAARAALAAATTLQNKALAGRAAQKAKADSDVVLAKSGLQEAQHKRDSAALARDSAISETAADIKAAEQSVTKAQLALTRAKKTLMDLETLDKVGGVSRNDLEGAQMQLSIAQVDYDSAAAALSRIKQGPGGVPFRVALAQAEVNSAELGVSQADSVYRTAKNAREKLLAVADGDISSAQASVNQARVGVTNASDAVSAMRLVSPIDGIASSVGARVGETAQPGTPLVTIVSLRNLRIEALISARNLPSVRAGMHVSVSVDTQPGKTYDAVASEISSVAEADQRSVKVKFRLIGSPNLRAGLGARIVIGSHG
jgi:HlyD family secretion protein